MHLLVVFKKKTHVNCIRIAADCFLYGMFPLTAPLNSKKLWMCTHFIFLPCFVPLFSYKWKLQHMFCKLQISQLSFCSSDHLLMLYRQQTEQHYLEALNSSWKLDCILIKNYMLLLFKKKKRKNPSCLNNHCITNPSVQRRQAFSWSNRNTQSLSR